MKQFLISLLLLVNAVVVAQDAAQVHTVDDDFKKWNFITELGIGFSSVNIENTAFATLSNVYAGSGVQYNLSHRFGIRGIINSQALRGDIRIDDIDYDLQVNNIGLNIQAVGHIDYSASSDDVNYLEIALGANVLTQLSNQYRSHQVDTITNFDRGTNVQLSTGFRFHIPFREKSRFHIGIQSFVDMFRFGYNDGRDFKIESSNLIVLGLTF